MSQAFCEWPGAQAMVAWILMQNGGKQESPKETACRFIGQSGAKNGEWRSYGGDTGSTRYSPLDQITAANFNKLEIAWRFKTDSLGPRPEYQYEGTPLMVKGVVYGTGGTRRDVFALRAETGELLWVHPEFEGAIIGIVDSSVASTFPIPPGVSTMSLGSAIPLKRPCKRSMMAMPVSSGVRRCATMAS